VIRYDKLNKKAEAARNEIERLERENIELRDEARRIKEVLDSTLHEVRRFSGELGTNAETLSRILEAQRAGDDSLELAQTVFYTAGMISARLGFTDLELNPQAVSRQATLRAGIYKKFEKASHVLALKSRSKRVPIQFRGNSYIDIDALPAFELVPFVILDNAIKYSPSDRPVTVAFEEVAGQHVHVTVSSFGPYVESDELPKIFDKNVRGRHAKGFAGDGLGLYLTKFLCDYHDVTISVDSRNPVLLGDDGRSYGDFSITLFVRRR
jgi:signal transduction histidine kinase